ncbi:3D (Asp-Asp-Asp) domain-containing protein/predicted nucleic acid-binding Zn-ribbon protein [Oikeobacillus pervagus]|uniref:3D (Asp-Asp-Asp) domain-containing protein/predicted nucleic acid-binding Zn-ribbon protein n=1 Tax=Oikeobacillus pervagus TaxID=1325931 RepID=A0AAJ1WG03_9BACI|nr:3D domain-containing protein [Oikeobacillus pervagus]MDQ0214532.1 3D (Asp-Asp-Asp) domain-containing protein/predicted nucleic acid-binding Zn-ribbon protein [Oikeobacillus pervagus]
MRFITRTIAFLMVGILLCIHATIEVRAETSQESLHKVQKELLQNKEDIQQKEKEKTSLNKEIKTLQQEWKSLQTEISNNEKELNKIESKIKETNKEIEKKKEEIVKLEDEVLARESIISKRMIAYQEKSRTNLIIDTLLSSEGIGDFFNRVNAVTLVLDADQDILTQQQQDLEQIEKDKQKIAEQEAILKENQGALAVTHEKLEGILEKRQETIKSLQSKYALIEKDIDQSKKNDANLQSQIKQMESKIKEEQKAAKERAERIESETAVETTPNVVSQSQGPVEGKELYVTATAYSHEENGSVTALGYNIKKNPNMKLIAVDPSVIPLGKRVWVEGYGEAIAGDTGGAIKGHKIDVLMPNKKAANAWGRRTVKIIILN